MQDGDLQSVTADVRAAAARDHPLDRVVHAPRGPQWVGAASRNSNSGVSPSRRPAQPAMFGTRPLRTR